MKLIPTIGKRPIPRNWQSGYVWDGNLLKRQDGVGFLNGEDGVICLDFDQPEVFHRHEQYLLRHAVNSTQKGFHVYLKPEQPLIGNVEYVKFGEVRIRKSHNLFPYDLPYSRQYKHITPFNPKTISNSELRDFLSEYVIRDVENTTTKGNPESVTLVGSKVLELDLALDFELGLVDTVRFLPIDEHKHNLMLSFCRHICSKGHWDDREVFWTEWVMLNKFKVMPDEKYMDEFRSIARYFNPNKVFSRNSLFNSLSKASRSQVFKSEQKRVDWVIDNMFRVLGSRGQFHFSTRFRWDDVISDRIHPEVVSRAIERLLSTNKVVRVKDAWRWTSTKKKMMAAEYKLVP